VARPEGFEPPTNGFGSHYSIRLSYGRVVCSALAWVTRRVRARAEGKYSGVGGTRPRVRFRMGVVPGHTSKPAPSEGSGVIGVSEP
jgi:hypothetical protein